MGQKGQQGQQRQQEQQEQQEEQAGGDSVEVEVPDGAKAGDIITLELPDGSEVDVEIPNGLVPGDVFDIDFGQGGGSSSGGSNDGVDDDVSERRQLASSDTRGTESAPGETSTAANAVGEQQQGVAVPTDVHGRAAAGEEEFAEVSAIKEGSADDAALESQMASINVSLGLDLAGSGSDSDDFDGTEAGGDPPAGGLFGDSAFDDLASLLGELG